MLKFLLIIILLFFVFSFISRLFLGRIFRNFRKNMNQQYHNEQEEQKPEGHVTIKDSSTKSKQRKKQSKRKNDQGEYVDYEEIE